MSLKLDVSNIYKAGFLICSKELGAKQQSIPGCGEPKRSYASIDDLSLKETHFAKKVCKR